ncbi:MAG TPA: hypothetical protein VFE11_13480 [Dongiaceae bacterium]|jgi:hypothetical protein|nr:hypothetical protein [Dongiaceae bacterium]
MRRLLILSVLVLVWALARPTLAADSRSPEDLAVEGMDKMKQAFEELLRSIPRFEAPIITDDGDVIIRRQPPLEPQPAPEWPPQPHDDFGGVAI